MSSKTLGQVIADWTGKPQTEVGFYKAKGLLWYINQGLWRKMREAQLRKNWQQPEILIPLSAPATLHKSIPAHPDDGEPSATVEVCWISVGVTVTVLLPLFVGFDKNLPGIGTDNVVVDGRSVGKVHSLQLQHSDAALAC